MKRVQTSKASDLEPVHADSRIGARGTIGTVTRYNTKNKLNTSRDEQKWTFWNRFLCLLFFFFLLFHLLESVHVGVRRPHRVRDDEEGGAFEEDDFIRVAYGAELLETDQKNTMWCIVKSMGGQTAHGVRRAAAKKH